MATPLAAWRCTRSGSQLDETGEIKQRARTFATSVSQSRSGVSLVAHMDEDAEIARYVIAPAKNRVIADNAAAVVGANVVDCDELPDLNTPIISRAVVRRGRQVGVETQAGSQINLVSEAFERNAIPGDWVAIHLRKPSTGQQEVNRQWHTGTVTHHSLDPNALVATITAGSKSESSAAAIIAAVCASMPGFDLNIRAQKIGSGPGVWALGALSAAAYAGGIASGYAIDGVLGSFLPGAMFAWGSAGHWPHLKASIRNKLDRGQLPAPGGRIKRGQVGQDGTPKQVNYPLSANTFMLGPDVPIGLLASAATGSTEATTTRKRKAPLSMLSNIGPILGEGAHLCAETMFTGILGIGQAGWGKSVLVRSVFGWVATDATRGLDVVGATHEKTAIVAYENKGEGAEYYQRWAKIAGLDLLRMDVLDPSTPAINMFSTQGTYEERAAGFAAAMKEAWTDRTGSGAIQYKSLATLTTIFTAALWLSEHPIPATSPLFSQYEKATVTTYAKALCHPTAGEALGQYVINNAVRDEGVVQRVSMLYGQDVTRARRVADLDAPSNKIDVLDSVSEWFDPKRPKAQWSDILLEQDAVVLNLGSSLGRIVPDEASNVLSRMTSYLLVNDVRRICQDWERDHKSLYIFADELSLLVGDTGEHIEWLREKARSYGVRLVVATQMLGQLPERVRASVQNYGNILWFAQNSQYTVNEAISDLSLSGDEWTGSDVANLPRYHVAARLMSPQGRQAPFTVKVDYFEGASPTGPWAEEAWWQAVGSAPTAPLRRETPKRAWMTESIKAPQAQQETLFEETGATIVDSDESIDSRYGLDDAPQDI